MFATNVVYPALASADQFVIGPTMGVTAVTHYAVPMSLVQRSGAIPVASDAPSFPACPVCPAMRLLRLEHARFLPWPMALLRFALRR